MGCCKEENKKKIYDHINIRNKWGQLANEDEQPRKDKKYYKRQARKKNNQDNRLNKTNSNAARGTTRKVFD